MKENHPEFNELQFESFLQSAEKDQRPPEAVAAFLTASLTKAGYLEPEDESEEEPEPPSWLEDTFRIVSGIGKAFLATAVLLYTAKKVYNNDPVRALTSVLDDATFSENAPESHKQIGKMTVEEFFEVHKEKAVPVKT